MTDASPNPRQWVNLSRTVLVTLWPDGTMTVARREQEGDVWGPPTEVVEEA
jgi:hypothetical protein